MPSEVPRGWSTGKFGQFIALQRGFDLPVHDRQHGTFAVIASNGQIDCHTEARVSGPTVVTGRSGTLGKVFYVKDGCWPLNTTLYVKDFHGNDPEFIACFLQHFKLDRFGTGTGVPTLNRNVVHEEDVILPPLPEQRRIAEILSSVDEAIAATRAVIEQTRKVKQAVLERLLTKGIGHTRFEQTEIGEIPEGWEVVHLENIAQKYRNSFVIGPFGSDLTMKDYRDAGVPVVFVRDVQSENFSWKSQVYVSEEKAEKLRAHSVRSGDIVITKMGLPPGIAAQVPLSFGRGIVTADIIRIRPDPAIAEAAFLALALNGQRMRDAVAEITGGQTRPKITLRDYKEIRMALPPVKEQRVIFEHLEPFSRSLRVEAEKLESLETTKSALMSDLLTGRKRVSDRLTLAAE